LAARGRLEPRLRRRDRGSAACSRVWCSAIRRPSPIAESTRASLAALGIHDLGGLVPRELFTWSSLATVRGWIVIVGGGFLVGFGTAYAGGCTSGHGISGVANLEIPSFIALAGFFAGGLLGTFVLLPLVLGLR
jgi:uncharacterized membrane protein YedE/YeeE